MSRPGHPYWRPAVGGAIVIGTTFFYPYYYYPYYYPYYPYYYPPAYAAAPAYSEPPTYVEQGPGVQYYCPDYRDYYPNVATCPSQWLQVIPDGAGAPPN
jgi:hypothetical protein